MKISESKKAIEAIKNCNGYILNLNGLGLTSLEGLVEALKHYEKLGVTCIRLKNNNLTSLEYLPLLKGLETLSVGGNSLTTLEHMPILPKLSFLIVPDNKLTSLEHMPQLKKLEELNVEGNSLKSLESTPNLPNLVALYVGQNLLTNLKGIENFNRLMWFFAQCNGITSPQMGETYCYSPQKDYIVMLREDKVYCGWHWCTKQEFEDEVKNMYSSDKHIYLEWIEKYF